MPHRDARPLVGDTCSQMHDNSWFGDGDCEANLINGAGLLAHFEDFPMPDFKTRVKRTWHLVEDEQARAHAQSHAPTHPRRHTTACHSRLARDS